LANVLDAAKRLKLRTAHFRPAMTQTGRWVTPVQGDGKGFPDLVIVGPSGSLLRELKSATGSLSAEQREWLGWLKTAGLDADVWKPRDWHSDRILSELRAIAKPKPHCHVVRDGDTEPCTEFPGEPHVDGDGREYVTVPLARKETNRG
ncbi:MAG TPA: VRR-NUC domain-containing protein, partial [Micromonosporaceae bacterium]|nr:VRR-NUC domain-containing protein [Micromonosporaceae bacterium]